MVGFANRQSFYASFYKINRITPRDYRIQQLGSHPHPAIQNEPKKRGRKPGGKNKPKVEALYLRVLTWSWQVMICKERNYGRS